MRKPDGFVLGFLKETTVSSYNWNAKAELHAVRLSRVRPGWASPPQLVENGTVADCIKRVMAKRRADRRLFSIMIGVDFGMNRTILNSHDIEQLYDHPDFPRT